MLKSLQKEEELPLPSLNVQGSVEGVLMADGMTDAVKWLKKKEQELNDSQKNKESQSEEASNKKKNVGTSSDNDPMKSKLNEVLAEGLFDSVLPNLVQNLGSNKKSSSIKPATPCQDKPSRRKSLEQLSQQQKKQPQKTDSEVEIHVCDELKNTKRTFLCNQKLLVEKMGYFKEVTVGQSLEDMDISVHCDISIFEWLMKWVKKDSHLEEDWPQLDATCVVPVLVSAAFLQMEPLMNDCLLFCHEKMNEIIRTSTNMSCLNDMVLTRLADMYTNVEVEAIKDRKDKIQSRLFAKLILSLAEPEPEGVRGHWNSMASVFKCEKCLQLIHPSVALNIPCIPSCMRLQTDGSIINIHVKEASWDLNTYVLKLFKKLKNWRRVYWRLWGDIHFLYCTLCKRFFPANQLGWCRYHPDLPQFFTTDAQKAPLPVGRYPCCGERAYKFQLIDNFSGCQFKQHLVCLDEAKDGSIMTLLEAYNSLICREPPQLLFPERLTRLVARDPQNEDKKFVCKETFWWEGLEIVPPRPKLGLLSGLASINKAVLQPENSEDSSEELSEEESKTSSSSRSEQSSAESSPAQIKVVKRKKKRLRKNNGKLWQATQSARSNQDNQRANEESVIKEITNILSKNHVCETSASRCKGLAKSVPIGGLWARLECEWRESVMSQTSNSSSNQTTKPKFINGSKVKARGRFS